jgi:hypothetical protein
MSATAKQVLELAAANPRGLVGYVHPNEPMSDSDWPAIIECRARGWIKFHMNWRKPPASSSKGREHTIWEITEAGRDALNPPPMTNDRYAR